jgi:hypothetical protein
MTDRSAVIGPLSFPIHDRNVRICSRTGIGLLFYAWMSLLDLFPVKGFLTGVTHWHRGFRSEVSIPLLAVRADPLNTTTHLFCCINAFFVSPSHFNILLSEVPLYTLYHRFEYIVNTYFHPLQSPQARVSPLCDLPHNVQSPLAIRL